MTLNKIILLQKAMIEQNSFDADHLEENGTPPAREVMFDYCKQKEVHTSITITNPISPLSMTTWNNQAYGAVWCDQKRGIGPNINI